LSVPPSFRISTLPSAPPSVKLSFPPSGIPSFQPSIPPSGIVSFPPSVPPSIPPSGIVSFPPSVPPSIPPSIPPIVPPVTPPPEKPPPVLIPKLPELFWERPKKKGKYPFGQEFAFTPDFIAAVLNQFGPQPKPGQIFTGQERRFRVSRKRFVTPLPEKGTHGIFGLIRKQLEA
jgi:hypothetical protein